MSDASVDILYLSEQDMIKAGVKDMPACIETMEETLKLLKAGNYRMGGKNGNSHGCAVTFPESSPFPEMPLDGPDRRFIAMPAYLGGKFDMAGMKWYGSNATNREKGLPRSILMVVLNDKETGAPKAFMSANLLSAIRTGAIPGVGFKYLAPENAETLGIVGPGVMSKTALMAVMATRPTIKTVKIKGRGKKSMDSFINFIHENYPGVEAYAVDSIEDAVRDCDIVSTAASVASGDSSTYPYIAEEWIKPGALVEITATLRLDDDFLVNRARVVADNLGLYESWEEEYGPSAYDIVGYPIVRMEDLLDEGKIDEVKVDDIADILLGNAPVHRNPDEITFYNIGGMPVEDIAWGTMCYRKAVELGIGTKLNLWDVPDLA